MKLPNIGYVLPEKENDIVAPAEPDEAVWLKSGCCPETFQWPVYSMLASWSSTMKVLLMKKKKKGKDEWRCAQLQNL